ncbi:hypothetical protein N9355_01355 [Crocinitomicaceae bacterium]|nr:hypothetical protein [Crocinitomicaceae bacterium]
MTLRLILRITVLAFCSAYLNACDGDASKNVIKKDIEVVKTEPAEDITSIETNYDAIPLTAPSCDEQEGISGDELTDSDGIGVKYTNSPGPRYYNGEPYNGIIKKCKNGYLSKMWTYKNGKSCGNFAWYIDGQLRMKSQLDSGGVHGRTCQYYEGGSLKYTGFARHGIRENEWVYYDREGIKSRIETYLDDELIDCKGDCDRN